MNYKEELYFEKVNRELIHKLKVEKLTEFQKKERIGKVILFRTKAANPKKR